MNLLLTEFELHLNVFCFFSGCPANQVAYVSPATGQAQSCVLGQNICPAGFSCQQTTSGAALCCGGSGVPTPVINTSKSLHLISFYLFIFHFVDSFTSQFAIRLYQWNAASQRGFESNSELQPNNGDQLSLWLCLSTNYFRIHLLWQPHSYCISFQWYSSVNLFKSKSRYSEISYSGQTCPLGSNVYLEPNTGSPSICTTTFSCPPNYACTYSNALRQYYCCSGIGATTSSRNTVYPVS